jgi:hypothetical protein
VQSKRRHLDSSDSDSSDDDAFEFRGNSRLKRILKYVTCVVLGHARPRGVGNVPKTLHLALVFESVFRFVSRAHGDAVPVPAVLRAVCL